MVVTVVTGVTMVMVTMTTGGGGGSWMCPRQCPVVPLLILFTLCETSLPPTTDVTSTRQSAKTSLGSASTPLLFSCI